MNTAVMSSTTQDEGQVHTPKPRFARVPIELLHDTSVTHGAVRLYAHMIWRYGASQQNFEGRSSMAEMLGVSETTITHWIAELVAGDWIVVTHRADFKEGRDTNFYDIFLSRKACLQYRTSKGLAKPEFKGKPGRKSRKGVGGRPSHNENARAKGNSSLPPKTNSSSLPYVNSSSFMDVNSSSHDLDVLKDIDVNTMPPANAVALTPPEEKKSPANEDDQAIANLQLSLLANADAPDGKKTPPHASQLHVALIEAWMKPLKETIPPGVTVRPFVRLGKQLQTAGVKPEEMACAGELLRAWYDALKIKPTLAWSVAEVTLDIRRALQLCKEGIIPDRIAAFVKEKLEEVDPKSGHRFWSGKLLSFEYVANHIKEAVKLPPKDGDCWFDPQRGEWRRYQGGQLQYKTPSEDVWRAVS